MDNNIENTDVVVEMENNSAETAAESTGTENVSISALAVAKIAKELGNFNGGHREKVVSKFVASTLTHFCEESERFAKAVLNTNRTLSDTCAEVMAENTGDVSDIDVYRSAVKSYFPNAEVVFKIEISITGEDPSDEELNREPKAKVQQTKTPRQPKAKTEKESAKPTVKQPSKPAAASPVPAATKPVKPKEQKIETLQLTLF